MSCLGLLDVKKYIYIYTFESSKKFSSLIKCTAVNYHLWLQLQRRLFKHHMATVAVVPDYIFLKKTAQFKLVLIPSVSYELLFDV